MTLTLWIVVCVIAIGAGFWCGVLFERSRWDPHVTGHRWAHHHKGSYYEIYRISADLYDRIVGEMQEAERVSRLRKNM